MCVSTERNMKEVTVENTDNDNFTDEPEKKGAKNDETKRADYFTATNKSLEDQAGLLSQWFLAYLTPLLRYGATSSLSQEDIGCPSAIDKTSHAYETTKAAWQKQVEKVRKENEAGQLKYEAKLASMTEEKRAKAPPFQLKQPSVAGALIKGFGRWTIAFAFLYNLLSALLAFVPVLLLNDLVSFFEAGADTATYKGFAHPWVEVFGLFLFPLLVSLFQTRHTVIMSHCATYTRAAVSTLIYQKSLRVSAAGKAQTSTGQIVNMMSNDAFQLQRFLQFAGLCAIAPVQIIIALVLIYRQVGNATWVGVAFMVFLLPCNAVIFSVVGKMRRKVLHYSDLRVKMMNEILNGIRIIKYYAWEKPMGKEVGRLRAKELKALTNMAYVSAIGFSLILLSAPILQPILVFVTYTNIQDEPLTAATAFTTVALFNIMRFPFAFLPMGLLQYVQCKISVRRIATYLLLPELEEYVLSTPSSDHDDAESGSITMKHCSFSWSNPDAVALNKAKAKKKMSKKEKKEAKRRESMGDSTHSSKSRASIPSHLSNNSLASLGEEDPTVKDAIILRNITCNIKAGSLVAVVGKVGCGKSSFLSAILGEMEPEGNSKVYIPRDANVEKAFFTAYCAQNPWVINDTLRGNILFGRDYNQERYEKVIEACALKSDFEVLPAGDMTEIGERGINLSGGQKARVSLARSMYSEHTKVLLLDDPLSAVDAHVGEHLFSQAIRGNLSKGKTRVLVTHHVHFLARCDTVIVLDEGKIKHHGTYEDLVGQGVDFAGAIDVSKEDNVEGEGIDGVVAEVGLPDKAAVKDAVATEVSTTKVAETKEKIAPTKPNLEMQKSGKKLVTDEEKNDGNVATKAYFQYAKMGGNLTFLSIFVSNGASRAAEIMGSFWLAIWAERTVSAIMEGTPLTDGKTQFYVNIYGLFGLMGILLLTVRSLAMAVHRLYASKQLHENMTNRILRAPVSFFDVTPTGRVLNRFSADMDKVDLELTQSIGQSFSTLFNVLGAAAAIVAATKGTFLVPLVPISWFYYLIQKWFRKSSTELQRLTSIANSPIFADFSQILTGTSTVRAYGTEEQFFAKCERSFDGCNASYVLVQLANQWLGLRLDLLGAFVGAFVGGIAVATASSNFIPAGWLGLALSYSIEVTAFLKHGVRMLATMEADMSSVERILYYSEEIEEEAPAEIPETDPKEGEWPTKGEIEISNASMRYRDGPLVLKNLSLSLKGGEKVGVVGRTGSGKSSLMVALFRISEIETDGGKILIDGVDTAQVGTSAIRTNLSIIPQDPVMFSNTVRYNLDPFESKVDEELWDVLGEVQLAEVIAALPDGLDEQVAEGGENFSQGQRQLLCIARSILRRPKILIMDEATASIDNTTDAIIQRMIRTKFSDATVLTIAHRINTIMDSDRVLVLDDGNIAEFDSPDALMSLENGIFKSLVEQSEAAHSGKMDDC